jgi:hypothetical protein
MAKASTICAATALMLILAAPVFAQTGGGGSSGSSGGAGGATGGVGGGPAGGVGPGGGLSSGSGTIGAGTGGIGTGGIGTGSAPLVAPRGSVAPGATGGPNAGSGSAMESGMAPGAAPAVTGAIPPATSTGPAGGQPVGSATDNGLSPGAGTGANGPTDQGGGAAGPQTTRANPDAQCDVVLAHPADFTGPTVQACSSRKGEPAPARTTASGGDAEVRATDRPSEVQKSLEPSNKRAVGSICKGC